MIRYLFPILFLLFFVSCKEEDPIDIGKNATKYDTVVSGDYFPVYPNSYWKYLKLNGDTVIHKTDSVYTLWSDYNAINNPYDTTKYYVTKYDGLAVDKYLIHVGSHSYHESGWKRILPDSIVIGNKFEKQYIWPNTHDGGIIQTVDTSLYINSVLFDSVIVVLEYTGPFLWSVPCGITYYAKHIGIIKSVSCFYQSFDSIISEESLINYSIGR